MVTNFDPATSADTEEDLGEAARARVAAREEQVAEKRSALSDQKKAALARLLRGKGTAEGGAAPAAPAQPVLPRRPDPSRAVLSFAQERLWFLDRLEPGTALYSLDIPLRLTGRLDPEAARRSLGELVRRHEVLRTTFAEESGGTWQVIGPAIPPPLPIVDLRSLPAAAREREAARQVHEERLRPFDLERGPLLRALLLRLADDAWAGVFNLHHIVSDGWSSGILVREFGALYSAFAAGGRPHLPELPIQYGDFAHWQRQWLSGEVLAAQLAYWKRELADAPLLLELATDRPRPSRPGSEGAAESLELPAPLAAALRALSLAANATLFMTLLAAFQTLLHRYTGQNDVLVGSPIANRTRPETQELIGFFVNTLVLRGRCAPDHAGASFRRLLDRTREAALGAYAHQDLPFERLVEELQVERDLSHNPLFQVMFSLQAGEAGGAIRLPGLEIAPVELPEVLAKFDLGLVVADTGDRLGARLVYRADLFEAATVRRMLGHLGVLLEAVVADPGQPVSELPLLTAAERRQLAGWRGSPPETPAEIPVLHLFEEQARRSPAAPAVVFGEESLTYAELDRRAGRLARRLSSLGVAPEDRVGLLLDRSVDVAVGILGVWKAGAAYVPLDPTQPDARLEYLLEDAFKEQGTPVLVAHAGLRDKLAHLPHGDGTRVARVVWLGAEETEPGDEGTAAALPAGPGPRSLAYLIYTSGTTGKPKAVMVEHGQLAHTLWSAQQAFGFRPGDRMPCLAPFSFDIFLFELLGPLLAGGTVVLFGLKPSLDLGRLVGELPGMTLLHAVPALMRQIVEELERRGIQPPLRRAFVGGDAVPAEVLMRMRAVFPAAVPTVLYGPTEATIIAARHEATGEESRALLGRPLPGALLEVRDRWGGGASPAGVPGEVWIGGPGVTRGYLHRPELTAEKFAPGPDGRWYRRWYRTGDLARWLPDGVLEFLGRVDHQVKVRGFRIELGEIEAVLAALPGVREAVVLAHETRSDRSGRSDRSDRAIGSAGDRWLVAYVAGDAGELAVEELRRSLGERLPDYMVPAAWVLLDTLPLTSHGKVDRAALARLAAHASNAADAGGDGGRSYVAPRTPVEELLAGIWAELLNRERVGVDDEFFSLGGHSLLATRLVIRIESALGIDLPLRTVFEAPTVAGLAQRIEALLAGDARAEAPPIRPVPRDEGEGTGLPLSFAQERLWFLDRLEPGGAVYNMPAALELHGALDVAALERALREMVRRHESLRTTFTEAGGAARQRVHPPIHPTIHPTMATALPWVDLSGLAGKRRQEEARRLTVAEAARPFDLERGPLLRAGLLRLAAEEWVLLLTLHHIVSDGWSMGVLVAETAALYAAFAQGLPSPLPELPVQYPDFAVWQRQWLSGPVLETQLTYWRGELAGAPAVLELPTDRPRPPVRTLRGAGASLELPPSLAAAVAALGRRQGATLFMIALAVFQTLLWLLTDQLDLPVGTVVANRTRPEVEGLIGFFVNTLVLRGRLDRIGGGASPFQDVLAAARATCLGAYAHQDLPFERLVEELKVERSLSYSPLFQVLLAVQNAPLEELAVPGLRLAQLGTDSATAKFDLNLTLSEAQGGLTAALEYSTDLFDATTARRLLGHFQVLLAAAADLSGDPARPVRDLPLLGEAERHQLRVEWNDTASGYPRDLTLGELFQEQVARRPDAVALVAGLEQVTYGELDRRATALSRRLAGLGAGPEVPVALFAHRSVATITGLLAVAMAGGFSVPLDPDHPAERLTLLLDDVGASLVLVDRASIARLPAMLSTVLPATGARRVLLEGEDGGGEEETRPPRPDNLAYVMYTSGSTGRPKGVAVTHRNVNRLVRGGRFADLGAGQVFLQLAPLPFDASTLEVWGALANGGRLVLAPPGRLSLVELAETLLRHEVTTLWLTAGLFHQMVDEEPDGLRHVRQLLAGGDVLSPPHVRRALAVVGDGADGVVINGYGPTENTTFTCCHAMRRADAGTSSVPIGKPIADTRVHLFGSALQPVPAGVHGELFAGGDGMARGYFGRPDLTAERFVPDPVGGSPSGRLYRTGDLARWRPDGLLEFLGRRDQQVKLRGFRVEPGEIEAVLAEHPDVRQAAVVVGQDAVGGKRLVGYVAGRVEATELRQHLERLLPPYMVPSVLVVLETLPLTPNGKVDRRALPAPELERATVHGEGAAPRTATEELLAGIWADLLGLERVGAGDDFFALGGHSLLGTRLVSRLRDAFGVELPLRVLFEAPVLSDLAARLEAARQWVVPAPPLVPCAGELPPLSFAQERLWFLDRLDPGSAAYNLATPLRLSGDLDVAALAASLAEIARRHAALRTTFVTPSTVAGEPRQVIAPPSGLPLPLVDLEALPVADREAEAARLVHEDALRPFDLARGPLVRALLLRLEEREHGLILDTHHIVSDGWSQGVLVRESAALYEAYHEGRPSSLPALPELPIQYADFAVWQRGWLAGEALEAQLAYWREALAGAPALLELPTDRPRPPVQTFRGAVEPVVLSEELTAALRELCRREGVTLFMALLAGFQALLHRLSGQDDVLVGSPVANRNRSETEGLIGFFVNTLVLRGRFATSESSDRGGLDVRALLGRVRTAALDAYAHQDLPFERLVEELRIERSLAHGPLFQVMLALQNAPVGRLELPGLLLTPMDTGGGTAKFDLNLGFGEGGEAGGPLAGSLEYNTDLFDAVTARRLVEQWQGLLAAAVADPARGVAGLPLLTEAQRFQLLVEWNEAGGDDLQQGLCLHEMFAAQVRRTPEAEALVAGGRRLRYRELAERSRRLAAALRRLGVGPEVRVGVCLPRAADLVASLLGVLEAGGAYVPLDPAYPRDRLGFMLEDSGARVLVTSREAAVNLPGFTGEWLWLDGELPEVESEPAGPAALPGNLAYLIYTSGSTGRPKGVAIEHRSAAALVDWSRRVFSPEDLAGVLAATSVCFDLSVFEIFVTLSRGGRVVLAENALALPGLAAADEVTLINTVPSAMAELVRSGLPRSVRVVNLAGEPIPPSLAQAIHELGGSFGGLRLYDLYGPSEDTTYSTWALLAPGTEVTIGRPLAGTRAFVLDRRGEPVPAGVPGELYLTGAGLARGYLGRPDLTAERFLPAPFAELAREPGARAYRTGDLVRFRRDGRLDFLGRLDHQVKVRGFRVELGEIEALLERHPAVREAAVVVVDESDRADGSDRSQRDRRLIACVVPAAEKAPSAEELRSWLRERLPQPVVPGAFLLLAVLPLTPNGKVDRRALTAALATLSPEAGDGIDAAALRTPTEEILARLWEDLLGRERVGAGDDFFALGGHSLLGTRLISRLRDAFGVELPLRALFEAPRLSDLAARVEAVRGDVGGLPVPPLTAGLRGNRPRLSFAQERLWFLDQLDSGGAVYSVPLALRLHGRLDPQLFARILTEVVRRHEVLRTTFAHTGGEPYQVIGPPFAVPVPVMDLRGMSEAAREEEVFLRARAEAARPFDLGGLAKEPLLRALLLRSGEEDWVALLTLHHIVCDGWSMGVLLREIAALYEAFDEGRPSPLPELEIQYADYAVWQRGWLTGEILEAQLAYWRDELAGAPALLELPTDRPRPPVQTSRGAGEPVVLSEELTAALRELGRREGVTLFMVLLAGFQALLHRLSGQEDVLVGSPVANRNRSETEGLIGFFVNTLVLRARFAAAEPEGLDVRTLLGQARTAALNAYAHQDLPFERLVDELQIERSLAHGPLFQVVLALQNAPVGRLELPGLLIAPMDTGRDTAKFDLTLTFGESGGLLAGGLEYNTDLFDAATARRLIGQLEGLLTAVADLSGDTGRRVGELPLLTAAQRSQLLVEWNDTASGYPRDLTLAELFAEQVARRPDAVAVVAGIGGLEQVTYGELDRRSRALARRLIGLGTGPEVPVALFAHRSAATLTGLLAVTLAGGFYVPLDPDHPAERLTLLLDDIGASLLLADRESIDRLPATSARSVLLDGEDDAGSEEATPRCSLPDNLAYVMYTSGSTGRPKGVGVTHRNVNRLVRGGRFADLGAGQIFLQLAPLAFDASTLEVWGALANGGRLVLAPPGRLSLGELAETLTRHEVTTLWLTAGLFHQMVDEASDGLRHVRQLLAGGDVLSPPHVRRALVALADGAVINGYGPTENTTFTCCHAMRWEDDAAGGPGGPGGPGGWSGSVPIGKPIADTRVYLLDSAWQPVPAGVHGELFAGGDGMARGYFGRPELTAERFVPDPVGGFPGGRLYRTGDLARWRPDGVVEFLGRRDHQVKLRGFRVELGEIEALLAGHPEVRQAAVLVQDAVGGKRLVGYVAGAVEATALRRHLESLLPPYMVPAALVVLETLPLTPNGKVDRRALSRVETAEIAEGGEGGGEPRDVLELQLARIWREVLGVARLGIREDFFAAGGHSLLALSLMARVREQLGRDLPLAALFQAPTIESMAALLRRREGEEAPAVSCLVPIQPTGSHRPFFCVHPGGGDVLCYALLARYLGPDRPFYGLQSRGLSGEAEPLGRIEDMAALYLEELRRVQPAGPYTLGGWSLGCIVAFEMAHQLRQQGETVALLALLDGQPELGGEPEDDLTLLRDVVAYIENLWGRDLGLGPDELESLAPEERLPLVMEKLREADFLPPGTGPEQLVRVLDVYRANTRAARAYVAKPWPERVVFFRTGEVTEGGPASDPRREPDLGWGRVTAGVDIHAVPGEHLTMVAEPHVQELARQLARCLEEAEKEVAEALMVT